MKTELILAFVVTLTLTTALTQAEICPPLPGPSSQPDIWFDCWDCPYQCYGDADCQMETSFPGIQYPVGMAELNMYLDWWRAKDPMYNPCLDFDHDLDVDEGDWAIMERWLRVNLVDMPPPCPKRPLLLEEIAKEFLLAGSTYTVTWTDIPSSCSRRYWLEYSTDNGQTWLPIDTNSVDNSCRYDWLVPSATSDQCLLRIEDPDAPLFPDYFGFAPMSIYDVSDEPFTIYECQDPIAGDYDANCYVDFRDFTILALRWLTEANIKDLAAFADQWCVCNNPYDPACPY